ncbi:hypothetical protein LX32DRAFT_641900 [Colletotrichum zoysiae]|uniref:Uncharacterized protein n=1 Tax=Colletotrichum zoysiae TaxID=1216348 RepID=A0AAD9HCQ3_9PEZI|nr:hypothetical protein LX32DRAFT_641900 [Colletotrichum zoysiae]
MRQVTFRNSMRVKPLGVLGNIHHGAVWQPRALSGAGLVQQRPGLAALRRKPPSRARPHSKVHRGAHLPGHPGLGKRRDARRTKRDCIFARAGLVYPDLPEGYRQGVPLPGNVPAEGGVFSRHCVDVSRLTRNRMGCFSLPRRELRTE